MKRTKEGITIQNILNEKFLILPISLVSMYSHIIDITVIIGMDANIAPKTLFFFEISETKIIMIDEIIIFKMKYSIFFYLKSLSNWETRFLRHNSIVLCISNPLYQ